MAKPRTLKWRGEELVSDLDLASAAAIDSVLDECVAAAKGTTRFRDRTGHLRGRITKRAARATAKGIRGRWGVWGVPYAYVVEHYKGFLKEVADRIYPRLPDRLVVMLESRRNRG